MALLQRFAVRFEYPIYFTTGLFAPGNPHLAEALTRREPGRRHRVVFVVEREVVRCTPTLCERIVDYTRHHAQQIQLLGRPLVVDGGEACKTDPSAPWQLQLQLDQLGIDWQSCVIVVGGGALQDMAGFAASTLHRGVRVVRAPTTVLAQADSGVGVKNGVNLYGKKNLLGTFSPPFAVLNDARFLATLGPRDRRAGLAEAVKVGLVRDARFFGWLQQNVDSIAAFSSEAIQLAIQRCAQLHLEHIATSGDPFELGSARPLDFGHWAAHQLEAMTRHRLRHGEAVAIGIALDTIYSVRAGLLPGAALSPVLDTLERLGFRLWDEALELPSDSGRPLLIDGLDELREHLGGELSITLLTGIGASLECSSIDPELMHQAIDELRRRDLERGSGAAISSEGR